VTDFLAKATVTLLFISVLAFLFAWGRMTDRLNDRFFGREGLIPPGSSLYRKLMQIGIVGAAFMALAAVLIVVGALVLAR
jgi:hypothetical protein